MSMRNSTGEGPQGPKAGNWRGGPLQVKVQISVVQYKIVIHNTHIQVTLKH